MSLVFVGVCAHGPGIAARTELADPALSARLLAGYARMLATGGISHWPCTPDSGTINEAWDRDFLVRWSRNDRAALLDYSDEGTYRDAGQGGYEIRTYIAAAGAARGSRGEIWCYEPIPQFACGCTIGVMNLA